MAAAALSRRVDPAVGQVVRTLLLLVQLMYLSFYFGARLEPALLLGALVITASLLIPVRLFLATAVAFNFVLLPEKFRRLFPFLLPMDLLWALSPFLLIHHTSVGLALAMSVSLVYLPFAQRSLVLMFGRAA